MPSPPNVPNILTIDVPKVALLPGIDAALSPPPSANLIAALVTGKTPEGNWRLQTSFGVLEAPPDLPLQSGQQIQLKVESRDPILKLSIVASSLPAPDAGVTDLFAEAISPKEWIGALFRKFSSQEQGGPNTEPRQLAFLKIGENQIRELPAELLQQFQQEEAEVIGSSLQGKVLLQGKLGLYLLDGSLPLGLRTSFLVKSESGPDRPLAHSPSEQIFKVWKNWNLPVTQEYSSPNFLPQIDDQFAFAVEKFTVLLQARVNLPNFWTDQQYANLPFLWFIKAFQHIKSETEPRPELREALAAALGKLPGRKILEALLPLIEAKENSAVLVSTLRQSKFQDEVPIFERLGQWAQPSDGQNWRLLYLPIVTPQGEQVFIWADRQRERSSQGKKPYHFFLSFFLSALGQMQIEGLMGEKKLDLLIRSEEKLEPAIETDLQQIYTRILAETGFNGQMGFKTGLPFPFDPREILMGDEKGFPLWI